MRIRFNKKKVSKKNEGTTQLKTNLYIFLIPFATKLQEPLFHPTILQDRQPLTTINRHSLVYQIKPSTLITNDGERPTNQPSTDTNKV